MPNAYEVIGVPQDCDDDKVIKTAYHKLAMQFHPDKVPEAEKEAAQAQMTRINEAYDAIKTSDARKTYKLVQETNIQFEAGEYGVSSAVQRFDLQNGRDRSAMFKRWVKQIQLTQWFMGVGCKLQGRPYAGSLRFVRLSQTVDFGIVLDVLYRNAQNHVAETITVSLPVVIYAPMQITSADQLRDHFQDLPTEGAEQLFPVLSGLNPKLDDVQAQETGQNVVLSQEDVQITDALMETMQSQLMMQCMLQQYKAQREFAATHDVEKCDLADIQFALRQNHSQIGVIECPCVVQQYKFKGRMGWICAELASGAMCGTYQISKVKMAIVGALVTALSKGAAE